MNMKNISGMLQCSSIAALVMLCTCGCEKQKTVAVPHAQNDLYFEITADSTLGKYESVLPKIKRYGSIEKESSFWRELENLTVTNLYVVRIREKLDAGDYAGAEKLVDEMFVKYGTDDARVDIRKFVSALRKTDETISALNNSISSEEIRRHAIELREYAQDLPDHEKMIAYAAGKEASAAELEKLEKERPLFWLYGEAQEKREQGDSQLADLITALVAADNDPLDGARNAMVKELMNGGMFNVIVPVFENSTEKKGSEENKKKN